MKNKTISFIACCGLIVYVLLCLCGSCYAAVLDAESASHRDTAAAYEIVDTYEYPGFKVIQFNLAVLSHYSYMLISGNEAFVIDPGRDIFKYLAIAKKNDLLIKGVLLTHSHADFVAGHSELAGQLYVPIYISEKAQAGYPHTPLKDGSTISLGQVTIKILETPGHTLDCTTALVYGPDDKNTPHVMFSGDTLFVGSIGRPDLMGGTISAAQLASMAYDTWTKKLAPLDDRVVVFPAHGAGSLCGAHLSDDPFSTIGRERKTNPYVRVKSRSEFIAAIFDGLPDAPQYFKYNAALNKKGPELIVWDAPLNEITPDAGIVDKKSYFVVDVRAAKEYADGHIPNSVNIAVRGRFETWTGIIVPWDAALILTGSEQELQEAVSRLHRVGYTARCIVFEKWQAAGLPVARSSMIEPKDLYALMQKGEAPVLVDVRLPSEWMGVRIGAVVNFPLNQLDVLSQKLDPTQPVIAVCNSAYRSSMAVGILERNGFTQAGSLNGGSEAWMDAGLPVYGTEVEKTAQAPASASPKRAINLPDRVSPSELKHLLMDVPGSFDLVDIRPAEQFADYSLPGAVNADIIDIMNNPAYLTGAGPLILIDRDGSLAMIIAGMLFQKTQRQIKAVRGGLEAYWRESAVKDLTDARGPVSPPIVSETEHIVKRPIDQPSAAAVQQPAAQGPAVPHKPKKKSAGC